ncbi:MAG: hypothetical protein WC716_09010 [Chitinophagaceae bacterium]|jgi:hypothetical protein
MIPVLLIGMNPFTLDFSLPGFPEGMTAENVMEGIRSEQEKLAELGYKLDTYLPDLDISDMNDLEKLLQEHQYEGIIIGAGIRVPPSNFILFEQFINTVHTFAPQAKIMFNTNPADNVAAVWRWF